MIIVNTKKYVFAQMGRFQLELIYLYFPPSSVENKGKLFLNDYCSFCTAFNNLRGLSKVYFGPQFFRIMKIRSSLVTLNK